METPSVRSTTESEQARAIDAIVLAFAADPVTRWVWPEANTYLTHFPEFTRAFGGRAFGHGSAHCTEDFAAAALWLPPGEHPDEETMGAIAEKSVAEATLKDVGAVMEQMASFHPEEPHWYLPAIGVDPTHQGKGYGSALLSHALRKCDDDHLPAYLESSNPRNIPLYQRHGFEIIGEIQAGSSPTITPMLRTAR